jgi:hypothetical protein
VAAAPLSVTIRTYQVGFGDCFLLSFRYGKRDTRHVLVDFGSSGLPSRPGAAGGVKASDYMPVVARDIAEVCGSSGLTAVVASHRHSDHISGFATDARTGESGVQIRNLHPKLIVQPWTEDPDAPKAAVRATRESSRSRRSYVAALTAMQRLAQQVVDLAERRPRWMGPQLQRQLSFLGMVNIANESAVRNLIEMGEARGSSSEWLRYGSTTRLERLLPGVKVHVLGPPDLTQSRGIKKMRARHQEEYWHLRAGPPATGRAAAGGSPARRPAGSPGLPVEARWLGSRLDRLQGADLLEIVRSLDTQMNNTSLILLFEACGRRLLFPGDAQIENWSYALVDAPEAERNRALLAEVDVYKVGHHGSLNATPRTLLWEGFKARRNRRLHALLSTLPGKHGSAQSKTEVPRRTLLEALERDTRLTNTVDLPFRAGRAPCHVLEVTR